MPALVGLALLLASAPASAQSGGRIIFFEGYNRDSAFNGHRVMSGDGSTIRDLPEIPVTQLGRFALNTDGSRVAFVTPAGLFAADARFEDRVLLGRLIRFEFDDFVIAEPDWSPSGELIAVSGPGPTFNPPSDRTMGVSVVPARGGSQTFMPGSETLAQPSWAPDERRILAVQQGSNVDPISRLIVLDRIAGTATTLFEEQAGVQIYNPQWSPDGSQIVYEHRPLPQPTSALWRVAADGGGARQLTPEGSAPRWSPDGQSVAFVRYTSSYFDSALYTMRADGSGLRRVRSVRGTGQMLAGWVTGDLAPLAPTLGRSAVATGVRGTVLVRRAGSSGFRQLIGETTVPVGSLLDARRGAVRITTASNRRGGTQSGDFSGGLFQLRQSRKRSARGLTDLVLRGGSFNRCGAARAKRASASLSRRAIRRLRANAQGRFRTSGQNGSATVRSTRWETIDRCDGTLMKVQRGTVVVRDFRKRKNVVLKAGKSYLARARR